MRARVEVARERQLQRQGGVNAGLHGAALDRHCALGEEEASLLQQSAERLGLSARSYHRVLRVARTLTDLAGRDRITTTELAEALAYRNLDRAVTVTPAW
ncbi:hypothetical protein MNKW57_02780 [Biformimicrobium ophioploci]|uniref:Mg chelatase-related protein C-terminal domain-containing protein n=1 Tax=Biformimicrobium ophioploci TaxID=3036711 RepID=A0ABQ6LV78_9GAMM|nr:hypothetical protein MNKW57_02780 [Microbulbifer sp. NKW57]